MSFDTTFFYSFLMVFVRTGAMFASAPFFGSLRIPVQIRVGLSGIIALAMAPVLQKWVGVIPTDLFGLIGAVAKEVSVGVIIGGMVTMMLSAVESAGHYVDMQIGFAMANVIDPSFSRPVTLIASYKLHLAIVLFLIVNGHHVVLQALFSSYSLVPSFGMDTLVATSKVMVELVGQSLMVAAQIAAPVAGALLVADMALAAISKAVPQMNVLVVGFQIKIIIGLSALGVGMPAVAWAINDLIYKIPNYMNMLFRAIR